MNCDEDGVWSMTGLLERQQGLKRRHPEIHANFSSYLIIAATANGLRGDSPEPIGCLCQQ